MQLQTDTKGVLLDIEGTTSSISFVHDVMFPFVLDHLDAFLDQHFDREDVQKACNLIAVDADHDSLEAWTNEASESARSLVAAEIRRLMDGDVKATGLKAMQGLIWQLGFESGDLKAHVYEDTVPAIQRWRNTGLDVRIYSSGSIGAQRLFFGHLDGEGNCLDLFSGHYDTTIGGKKEPESYIRIAKDWGMSPQHIVFVSDVAEELTAASESGLQVVASVRPGNAVLPDELAVTRVNSFAEIDF